MRPKMTPEAKIKACIERHPDWPDWRIGKVTGTRKAEIIEVKRKLGVPIINPIKPIRVREPYN